MDIMYKGLKIMDDFVNQEQQMSLTLLNICFSYKCCYMEEGGLEEDLSNTGVDKEGGGWWVKQEDAEGTRLTCAGVACGRLPPDASRGLTDCKTRTHVSEQEAVHVRLHRNKREDAFHNKNR